MIAGLLLAAIVGASKPLPEGLKFALERHLPAWAQITSNAAPSSDSMERIAVERAQSLLEVFLIDRKIQLSVQEENGRYWVESARWCAEPSWKGRCPKVWGRSDSAWSATRDNYDKTGYDVYRDSLAMRATSWTDPVPPMDSTRSVWNKAACQSGLCFVVRSKDSSVGKVAIRPEGSIVWWEGGYVKGIPDESEMVHAHNYLLEHGRSIPFKAPMTVSGKKVWYDPSNAPSAIRVSTASVPEATIDPFLVDSLDALFVAVDGAPEQARPKVPSASKIEAISQRILSGKMEAKRQAGVDACSGADRGLQRYQDGSIVLLQGKREVAIQLQGSSLGLVSLDASMTSNDVLSAWGTPSRRGEGLFVYETDALDPNAAEVDQVHWKVLVQIRKGRVFRAILLRLYDDC